MRSCTGTRLCTVADVSLRVLLEAGRIYHVELKVEAFAFKTRDILRATDVIVRPKINGDPSLRWNRIDVTVGTDPQAVVADFQAQIDELWYALEKHRHGYLTGKGAGHNDKKASTYRAFIPPPKE